MSSMSVNKTSAIGQVSANVTSAQVFPQLQNALAPAFLAVTASGAFEQKKMVVRATGYAKTAGVTNVTVTLAAIAGAIPGANPLTLGSYTTLCASTARAQNTANAPWEIEAVLFFDSVSGKLDGFLDHAVVNHNLDARAILTNQLTGLAGLVGSAEPVFSLVVAVTFSAAFVGNIGNCNEIVIDA